MHSQKTRKQELRLLVVAGVSDESEHLHTRCAIVIHCGGGSTNHYKLCVKIALILMFAPLTQQTHHPIWQPTDSGIRETSGRKNQIDTHHLSFFCKSRGTTGAPANYLFFTSLLCLETVSSELDFVCIGKVGSILTAPASLLLLETAIGNGTQTGAHDVCYSHRLLSQGTRYTQWFLKIWLLDITTIVEESLAGSPSGVFFLIF